jgi:hypothetical protein
VNHRFPERRVLPAGRSGFCYQAGVVSLTRFALFLFRPLTFVCGHLLVYRSGLDFARVFFVFLALLARFAFRSARCIDLVVTRISPTWQAQMPKNFYLSSYLIDFAVTSNFIFFFLAAFPASSFLSRTAKMSKK